MGKDYITLEGLQDTFKEWVERSNEKVSEAVVEAVREQAEAVEETAKELCPVKSGLLRSTIHTTFSKYGHFAKVRTDEKKAPHGHLVHFGTTGGQGNGVGMKPRPFLYQADERHRAEFPDRIKEALQQGHE